MVDEGPHAHLDLEDSDMSHAAPATHDSHASHGHDDHHGAAGHSEVPPSSPIATVFALAIGVALTLIMLWTFLAPRA